ncbi:MAG: effector binding domain-containing protein [Bacteroidia bacterium]|nr:effector binding domain-containing protein [Bacteroidia bacterium]
MKLDSFKVIGISVKTTNENNQAMTDMGQLWNKFYSQNIMSKIPDKKNNDVYSIYTDYETDHTGAYTAIIGCKVNSLDTIPDGLIGKSFKGGKYIKLTAKGKMPDAVIDTWKEIWNKEFIRKYTVDFEVYGEKSHDPENAEVEIYIAVE